MKNFDLCIGYYYCMGNCNSSFLIYSVCFFFLVDIGKNMSLVYFDIVFYLYKDLNDKCYIVCSVY